MLLPLADGLLSPNLGLAFWVGLSFLLLLFLLGKFAWPAILGGLKERESTIEESMTRAENALAEASRLQSDTDAQRQEAGRQAQTILREAREQAAQMRDADVEKTKAEIARMQATALADIEPQKTAGPRRAPLRGRRLAIGAAEKILGDQIDADKQSHLVDRFVADLPTELNGLREGHPGGADGPARRCASRIPHPHPPNGPRRPPLRARAHPGSRPDRAGRRGQTQTSSSSARRSTTRASCASSSRAPSSRATRRRTCSRRSSPTASRR